MADTKNLPAKKQGAEITDLVLKKVRGFQTKNELDLPPNYSPSNALKSAYLILQETVDKNKKPALEVCTKTSIANALLDMVVQGLNPAKKQCYFIVRGKKLCLDRSYFGTKAVCKRVDKTIDDIFAEVVYKGDELEYRIERGQRIIENHTQSLENIDDTKIIAAYATVIDKDGEVKRCELMTLDQLKAAWRMSSMKPIQDDGSIKKGSTHGKFTSEMAKKTATSRAAKHIINSSSDEDLLIKTIRRNDDMRAQLEAEAEVEELANSEVIDIDHQIEAPDDDSDGVGMADADAHPPADVDTGMQEDNPYE